MDEGAAAGEAEPMDQGTAQTPGSQTLAQLSSTSDCYEAFLLNLLRVYTQNRIESLSNSETQTSTAGQSSGLADTNGSSGMTMIDSISPEAILALSHEQVQSLVTSNSSNYDVIHQILAYRQRTVGGGGSEGNGEKAAGETESTLQQLQALQLSPEQLKQIQLQMEELIRTKQIVLPAELSVEQQQQLLQSLILKHIHSQHQQLLATPSTTTTTTPPPATQPTVSAPTTQQPLPSSPPPPPNTLSGVSTNPPNTQSSKTTVGCTLAAILRGDSEKVTSVDGEEGGGGGGEIGRKEVTKMEVLPSPSSAQGGGKTKAVALQLSSNPVVGNIQDNKLAFTQITLHPPSLSLNQHGHRRTRMPQKVYTYPVHPHIDSLARDLCVQHCVAMRTGTVEPPSNGHTCVHPFCLL